jgi:dTDP-glucose 4,6-dehydratase
MEILVTGGAGFISHHLVEHILKNTDHTITILDKLTYASSGFDRLKDIGAYENKRVKIFTIDLSLPIIGSLRDEIGNPDWIIHMAAETHVDRSIKDPWPFIVSNVIGTFQILEFAKTVKNLKKFLYFSTDEVFGDAPHGASYTEWSRYNSRNPYAATKAGGEELCLAYANSYNIPMIITHAMNNFGERQHKEKLIPIIINKLKNGETLQIHCKDGSPASRSWIHARNTSSAVMFLLENTPGNVRDKYNITGVELRILDLAYLISIMMGKSLYYDLIDHYSERPGHDPRYMLDGTKLSKMGWECPVDFEASLEKTITWSLEHPRWLDWD